MSRVSIVYDNGTEATSPDDVGELMLDPLTVDED